MNRLFVSALFVGLLSACASAPMPSTLTNPPATEPVVAGSAADSAAVASSQTQQSSLPPHLDPKNPLSQQRSVYFDFDEFLIKDEYRSLVEAHAKHLSGNRNQNIRIEGNADEQGGREYNLALGQKRAQAVKNVMTLLGVQESQIEAISWGEERPKAVGHDESAWAQNRRADIKYGEEK